MRSVSAARLSGLVVASFGALLSFPASSVAQDSEHDWQKLYQVSDHPAVSVAVGDSAVEVRSCGGCRTIHVSVHTDQKLSAFELVEHQEGDHVSFSLKQRPTIGFHWNSSNNRTKVTVETPANLSLDARVADGGVSVHGLSGDFQVHSADGSVSLEDVHGGIRATTADGSVSIRRSSGELEARSSDGSVDIEGKYSKVDLHTSDGSVSLVLAEGSQLTSASRVESSDGGVSIRLPRTLAADLDLQARDGSVKCDLPLQLNGYSSRDSSDHHLSGHLNAGGPQLSVKTSDGSVKIAAL